MPTYIGLLRYTSEGVKWSLLKGEREDYLGGGCQSLEGVVGSDRRVVGGAGGVLW